MTDLLETDRRPAVLLETAQLTWTVNGRAIVDDVSVQVRAGEVLALVGPNGAGKSSLLALLAGDLPATAGSVLFHGVPLAAHPLLDLARRRSVLLQEHRMSFPFRVVEVVRMGRAPWRGTEQEDHDETVVTTAMQLAEVLGLGDRTFTTLSGGEKARTSFARTLAQQGGVLLLDEPTAALDIRHQERLLSTARELAAAGAGVVVVLHDLSLAAAYSDRIALLSHGRLVDCGTPDQVLRPEVLSAVYAHPVDVIRHPGTGELVVVPQRVSFASVLAGSEQSSGPAARISMASVLPVDVSQPTGALR